LPWKFIRNKKGVTDFKKSVTPKFLIPRTCRVLPSVEPAFTGGFVSRNAALAQAYRVISSKIRNLFYGIGSRRKEQNHAHRRV